MRRGSISRILELRQFSRDPGAIVTNLYPNELDLRALGATHAALTAAGVKSVTGGYEMAELASAIYAYGWSYSVDRAGGDFRATVEYSSGNADQFRAVGIGWSLESALAIALENALSIIQKRAALAAR